ncbi:TPA: hypothetical protein R1X56_001523 [Campylobacter upsaliensis]|nr:hypothetical protein [Campylobacter upsaliensis]
MQGKILADGLIGANDGNRYSFSVQDVRNLGSKTMSDVVNAEVDFEIDGTNAKSIFITKNSISIGNIVQGGDSISSIKTKAYIYVAGIFLGVIPVVGWIFGIVGSVFMILALLSLGRMSGAPLLRNFWISWGLVLLGGMIVGFSVAGGFIMGLDSRSGFSFGMVAFIVLGALICLGGLVFSYFYYRDLAEVTNEKFFLYAFICRAVAIFTLFIPILGIIFIIVANIVELIAWIKFKEIKKKEAL